MFNVISTASSAAMMTCERQVINDCSWPKAPIQLQRANVRFRCISALRVFSLNDSLWPHAEAWPNEELVQAVLAQISWYLMVSSSIYSPVGVYALKGSEWLFNRWIIPLGRKFSKFVSMPIEQATQIRLVSINPTACLNNNL